MGKKRWKAIKSGRSKKPGARTPSGRLSCSKDALAERGEAEVATVLAQPHRRWLPEEKRRDQLAASVLGRMHLAGQITVEQLWAGERFARLRREFARVMASPITKGSAGFAYVAERLEAVEGYEMQDEVQETDEERRDRVITAFNEVTNCIGWLNAHGPVTRELETVCHQDRDPANLAALLAGLTGLVNLWRIKAPEEAREIRGCYAERSTWNEALHERVPVDSQSEG